MSLLKVFNSFNERLITSLPMRDVIFLAKLTSRELFPGDLKNQVKEKSSMAEAVDHFLDNSVRKDLINNKDDSFIKLLSAMEEYSPQLKILATEIRDQLLNKDSSTLDKQDGPSNTAASKFLIK